MYKDVSLLRIFNIEGKGGKGERWWKGVERGGKGWKGGERGGKGWKVVERGGKGWKWREREGKLDEGVRRLSIHTAPGQFSPEVLLHQDTD